VIEFFHKGRIYGVNITKDDTKIRVVTFPYGLLLVEKIKTIPVANGILKRNTGVSQKGHAYSKTTEIYIHVSTQSIGRIKSPLDSLNL
jgi:hypothetical protein